MPLEIQSSPYVLGIDLGTSNSSVSIYRKGEAVIIPLEGSSTMPSVVRFPDKKKEGVVVGKVAKKYVLVNPSEVFSSMKTLMRDEDWKEKIENEDLKKKFIIEGEELSPTIIVAEILKKIINEVQEQSTIDLEGEISKAIICVPANSTENYKAAVYKAAEIAGLGDKDDNGNLIKNKSGFPEGVFLISEPTAAAIQYGVELGLMKEVKEQIILVYDFGGGTFDVTVLKIDSTGDHPTFTVLGTKGISKLGGDDLDQLIMDICAGRFKEESGIDIFDLKSDQKATSGRALRNAQQKLKEVSEEVKINFASGSPSETISITGFLKDGDGTMYNLETEIKKNDFIDKAAPLLLSSIDCVNEALAEAKLTMEDINRIILVGGSTKGPWIKDILVDKLGKQPWQAANVDNIVSQGAAIWGANQYPIEGANSSEGKIVIEEITSHHLGIEVTGQKFSPIIKKGLPLTKEIATQKGIGKYGNQEDRETLNITIWQTQKTIEFEEDGNRTKEVHLVTEKDDSGRRIFEYIGEFELGGIPKGAKGSKEVVVEMELDRQNMITVNATVTETGVVKTEKLELNVTKK